MQCGSYSSSDAVRMEAPSYLGPMPVLTFFLAPICIGAVIGYDPRPRPPLAATHARAHAATLPTPHPRRAC
jgi:hypothetical protein